MLPRTKIFSEDKNVLVRTSPGSPVSDSDFTPNDAGSIPSQGTKVPTSQLSAVRKHKPKKKRFL